MITVIPPGQRRKKTAEEVAASKQRTEERRGVPLTPKERAQHSADEAAEKAKERQEFAAKAKEAGMKLREMRAADGSIVKVWTFNASYLAMGFEQQQIAAAERFSRDWEAAYRGIRAQSFEPSTGGGPNHSAHVARVFAQAKLAECRQAIGQFAYDLIVAVAIYGASARLLHQSGAKQHTTVSSDIGRAFNDLYAFYFGGTRKDSTWLAVERFNQERAAMIEKAEREVG